MHPTEIHTWRDGLFMVRTRILYRGNFRGLPWLYDCFTHRGARRKARRTIRNWERERNPQVAVVTTSEVAQPNPPPADIPLDQTAAPIHYEGDTSST